MDVAYDRVPARPGEEVITGSLSIRVLATPGHTPTHLSYVVAQDGVETALCTSRLPDLEAPSGRTARR